LSLNAQDYTISGQLSDATNGEDLIGATVIVLELPGTGTVSNEYGFYSLSLPTGNYTIKFQFIGFDPIEKEIALTKNISLNIELGEAQSTLNEVVIKAEKENGNVTATEMSVTRVTPKDLEKIPVLFGEKDVIKSLQLTPGIKAAGEGSAGFYVRGGGIDQNLILLDEAPVYNASHLLGFFSVFNSDAIKDVALYKGGIPARYGGRASSVMDIKMNDGNSKKLGVSGGIGIISSRLTIEGPTIKDKGSFIVSGRRTYADAFLPLAPDTSLRNNKLYFYDLNAKTNYKINDKNRVFLSGYFGRDVFKFGDQFGFDWGNATGTLRWNHLFSEKLFSNTSVIFSDYNYSFDIQFDENASFTFGAGILDWNLKQDFTWFANAKNTVKYGFNAIYHTFKPQKFETSGGQFQPLELDTRYGIENGIYIQNEQKLGSKLAMEYGIRFSSFNFLADNWVYEYDAKGTRIDSTFSDTRKNYKTWAGFEPRINMTYVLNESSSIKASYNRMYQYIHLLSNTVSSSPTDLWVPSSNNVAPQIVNQVSLGYFKNLSDNMFETSLEVYYKTLDNQIDYRNGADLFLNTDIEADLIYGTGRAFGAELFLKKKKGVFTGWISYALSRSLRTFDEVNGGTEFPARQDRIHDIAVVGIYDVTPRLSISANWVFATGDAVTFPVAAYITDLPILPQSAVTDLNIQGAENFGQFTAEYTDRNAGRFPPYHRADVGVTLKNKPNKKFESSWNFSVYNVYSRENAFTLSFRPADESDLSRGGEAVQLSLFKIIPSVAWNFKF